MATIYLITGAAGHLGSTLVRLLLQSQQKIRALVLPEERHTEALAGAALYEGNICAPESLDAFFTVDEGDEAVVIHCAGIVTIASKFQQAVHDVNVGGTRNILDQCRKHRVKRLVYVSSVHAIPEQPAGQVIAEIDHFDPAAVKGLYAQTKAEATELVLEAARQGLDACVVHPSGIFGPYDLGRGHTTQLFLDYCERRLTAGVTGGYDFVDVRDVAAGILACCACGRSGECYILANRYFPIRELLDRFQQVTDYKPVRTILPLWFAKLTAPLAETYYRLRHQPPLFTPYSLYTLSSNALFSHDKAARELGYTTRPMNDTIRDTQLWLEEAGRLRRHPTETAKRAKRGLRPARRKRCVDR